MRLIVWLILVAAGLGLTATAGRANPIEKLLMPGPLIEGHSKYEARCESCHEPFRKDTQVRLCLACHKDVASDIEAGGGFHGRHREVRGAECKRCHTDHKGRGEDIVRLDTETFDHGPTDFRLTGSHKDVDCALCHAPKRKYRDAPAQCSGCHTADDPHGGALGQACSDCHNDKTWAETRFDHGRTKFALRGAHAQVACKSCHARERYEGIATQCIGCHRVRDVHAGAYGQKCQTCHVAKSWQDIDFDHARDTSFALEGKHRQAPCRACHSGDLYKQDLKKTCFACHQADDVHKGRNGAECAKCHGPSAWRQVAFDHDKQTKFALKGRHARLACEDCHAGPVHKETLATACAGCHRIDDVHKRSAGEACADCHTSDSWKPATFDHGRNTQYPLKGLHQGVACQGCHKGTDPKKEKLTAACVDCHRNDDVHKGQEGPDCVRCHNERGWGGEVFFDHGLVRFPLIGLHALVPCEECHLTPAYRDTPDACVDCHRPDDVHKGRLAEACHECHNPNGWAFWRFDHARTDFALTGAHDGLGCLACHKKAVEGRVALSTACASCHRIDDVHRGSFGAQCGRCHDTRSFAKPLQVR